MQWEYLGYAAGLISMFGFVPQVRQMYKTKSASDVSLVMLVQNSLGTFLWLLYGNHLQDTPMIMANTVAFSTYFAGTVLYFKYRKSKRQSPILLASSTVPAYGVEKYIPNEDYGVRGRVAGSTGTEGKLNLAVYGSTGGYPQSEKDYATRSCRDLRTITATAGEILELLSKSEGMEIQLIGKLSSSGYKCMTIYGRNEDFPCLDEAIRHLDSSGIIDLKHWERVGTDSVFLVYGPGDSITTL